MAQLGKNLPVMQTWLPSLGGEEPLEKEAAAHSSVLARRIPWPSIVHGSRKELDMTE